MATLERNYSFHMGLETVYGNGGASFTYLPVFVEGLPQVSFTEHEQNFANGTLARNQSIMGTGHYEIPAKFYIKGSGIVGIEPEIHKMFRAAGLTGSATGDIGVRYYANDTYSQHQSYGVRVNLDGLRYGTSGCRISSLTINLIAGEPAMCEANIKGFYLIPAADAYSAPSYSDATVPPIVEQIALTIDSVTHDIKELTLKLDNEMLPLMSINAANRGIKSFDITGRNWAGSFKVARDTSNDVEYWTNIVNSTQVAVASSGFGSEGNRIAISIGNMQIQSIKPIIEDDRHYYEVEFRINKADSSQAEMMITFT